MFTKDTLLTTLKSVKRADPEDNAAAEIKTQIIRALSSLPLIEKSIIYSRYMQGMKWEQISVQNKLSPHQCRNVINRGLDNLLRRLNEKTL